MIRVNDEMLGRIPKAKKKITVKELGTHMSPSDICSSPLFELERESLLIIIGMLVFNSHCVCVCGSSGPCCLMRTLSSHTEYLD